MYLPFVTSKPNALAESPTKEIAPNHPLVQVTDHAGEVEITSTYIKLTRVIDSGVVNDNFRAASPGARVRVSLNMANAGEVLLKVEYTGLLTRVDTHLNGASILVNGEVYLDFNNTASWTSGQPHPVQSKSIPIILGPGNHLIELIWPTGASMNYRGLTVPFSATPIASAPRPTEVGAFVGDSITHGYTVDYFRLTWVYQLAELLGTQYWDCGYGGRQLYPQDLQQIGALNPDYGVYLILFNNFYPGGANLTELQASYVDAIEYWLAENPGKPLNCITPFYSTSDAGQGGLFDGNIPTLEQIRQVPRNAVLEVGNPLVTKIEGASGGMPASPSFFNADGIHPANNFGAAAAPVLLPQIQI